MERVEVLKKSFAIVCTMIDGCWITTTMTMEPFVTLTRVVLAVTCYHQHTSRENAGPPQKAHGIIVGVPESSRSVKSNTVTTDTTKRQRPKHFQ